MRVFLWVVLLVGFGWTGWLRAADFDYYVLSLSWSPEFCHEHPTNRTSECNAQAKMNFVVHGLWPSKRDGSEPVCTGAGFDPAAVPKNLAAIMPGSIFRHEWEKHGACSGMTESVYFQKIAGLYGSLAIPVKATGEDQRVTPQALRQQFAQANAQTTAQSFAIEDRGGYLTEVRSCWDRSFQAMACPSAGDMRRTPITIRGRP